MPIIEWDTRLEIGISSFDEHHKHLVSILNSTYDALICEAPADIVGDFLAELFDYAGYHFVAEESWMKAVGFPRVQEHVEEHNRFTQRLVELAREYRVRESSISLEVLTFLKEWLIGHILISDADYGRFATDAGTTSGDRQGQG